MMRLLLAALLFVTYAFAQTVSVTTTTSTITLGTATGCTPGQLVNVTYMGMSKIAACATYTDFGRGIVASAVWKGQNTLRVEVSDFADSGNIQRVQRPLTVNVYDLSNNQQVASGSGTDFVELTVSGTGPFLIDVYTLDTKFSLVKYAQPPSPATVPASMSSVSVAVVTVALIISLIAPFVSEYVGGSSALITGLLISAVSVIGLPRLGVPEAIATSVAVLTLIFSAAAYARSARE